MDENRIRLDSLVRSRGFASRKELRLLASRGLVALNGETISDVSVKVSPDDIICIAGNEVPAAAPLTIMMNKPAGYASVAGESIHPTVFTLLGDEFSGKALFCIGRLDAATEGLLLLTNDGALCEKIIRPEGGIKKKYLVTTDRPLRSDAGEILARGAEFPNGDICRPAVLEELSDRHYYITVTEGKYHEVRRMVRLCGAMTDRLIRVSIGRLNLDPDLEPGCCRRLPQDELRLIFE